MHALVIALVCLAQVDATTPPPTDPTTTTTPTADDRALTAMERTAAAAERTAAAAEKLAQSAEKLQMAQGGGASTTGEGGAQDPSAWTGAAGLGLVWLTGNAEALTLTSLTNLEKKTENWIVRAKATGAYGQARPAASTTTEAEIVALRALGELRGDRRFTEKASGFLLGGAETDHVKSVELRYYGEAGASMIWLDDKAADYTRLSLRTDLALRYLNEQRFQYYPTPLNVDDIMLFGPRFGVNFKYGISKDSTFIQDAEVIPNIVGTGRVLFNGAAKISSKLTSSLALAVSFVMTHDSQPAPGKRTTDTALTAGLDLTL